MELTNCAPICEQRNENRLRPQGTEWRDSLQRIKYLLNFIANSSKSIFISCLHLLLFLILLKLLSTHKTSGVKASLAFASSPSS